MIEKVGEPRKLGLDAAPPDFGGMREAIDRHLVGLAAGLRERLVFGLANLDPQTRAAGEVRRGRKIK